MKRVIIAWGIQNTANIYVIYRSVCVIQRNPVMMNFVKDHHLNGTDRIFAMTSSHDSTTSSAPDRATSMYEATHQPASSSSGRDQQLALIEIAVQSTIFTMAVLGNGAILIALFTTDRHKRLGRMNLMIVHLSFADLFVAFFNVLPQLLWDVTEQQFYGNDFLCRGVAYLQAGLLYRLSSILINGVGCIRW